MDPFGRITSSVAATFGNIDYLSTAYLTVRGQMTVPKITINGAIQHKVRQVAIWTITQSVLPTDIHIHCLNVTGITQALALPAITTASIGRELYFTLDSTCTGSVQLTRANATDYINGKQKDFILDCNLKGARVHMVFISVGQASVYYL